jgi:hypothetical protein
MTVDHVEQTDHDGLSESGSPRVSRRTILAVGWSTPVILAVAPSVAFAASGAVSGTSQSRGTTGAQGASGQNGSNGSNGGTPGDYDPGQPGVGGIGAEQHQGAEPARVNRGFTG